MPNIEKIILVGHCTPDNYMLKSTVARHTPGVDIQIVNDQSRLDEHADGKALLLVNRVLDGSFDAEDGIDLIKKQASKDNAPTALLISNYDEYQEKAKEAGAVEGFGKSELENKAKDVLTRIVSD